LNVLILLMRDAAKRGVPIIWLDIAQARQEPPK